MRHFQLSVAGDILVDVPPVELFYLNGSYNLENRPRESGQIWVPDERISRCLEAVDNNFTEQDLSVSFLSAASFLSPGRLAHLFKKQLGVTVHQYILWKKVIFAITESRKGSSLTECADAAGFVEKISEQSRKSYA